MGVPFASPGAHVAGDDGFTPPASYGGTVAVKIGTFDHEDITTAKTMFTLPAGAIVLDWWFDVTTDFNAGTNNNLDLGAAADPDYFANDIAIGTQGLFRAGVSGSVADRLGERFDEDTAITVLYQPSGTTVTAGEAKFFMSYMMGNDDFAVV